MPMIFFGPDLPVREGPRPIRVRTFAHDQVLPIRRDVAQARPHAQPVRQVARLVRAGCAEVETHRAVDRTLLDGVLAEDAILRIHPRALGALAFLAVLPRPDAVVGTALTADHDVAVALVGEHLTMAGPIEHG